MPSVVCTGGVFSFRVTVETRGDSDQAHGTLRLGSSRRFDPFEAPKLAPTYPGSEQHVEGRVEARFVLLGQHDEEVLNELPEYSSEEVRALEREGVV